MKNESWMQPALLSGEAVLLPALERPDRKQARFGNQCPSVPQTQDAFQPANVPWEETQPKQAMLIHQSHGSMAGRSVLRAAGVQTTPLTKRCRRCR